MLDAEYTKAIRLAFELRRPHKVYELFAGLCKKRESDDQIVKALQGLEKKSSVYSLNTSENGTRNQTGATLPSLFFTKPSTYFLPRKSFRFGLLIKKSVTNRGGIIGFVWLDLGVFFWQVKGIGELLEGLIPYSQRHFNRMDRFVRSSFLLDYTLGEMSVIDPETETEYRKDKKIEEEVIPSVSAMEQDDQKTPSRKRKSQKSKDKSNKKRLVEKAQGNVIAV